MPFYDLGHYQRLASLNCPFSVFPHAIDIDQDTYIEILGMINKVCFYRFSVEIVPSPLGEPAPPSAHLFVFSTLTQQCIFSPLFAGSDESCLHEVKVRRPCAQCPSR